MDLLSCFKVWQLSFIFWLFGITRCDKQFCYKLWLLLLQSVSGVAQCDRLLLQSASGIAKCDRPYYKVHQVLQCVTVITKGDVTPLLHQILFQFYMFYIVIIKVCEQLPHLSIILPWHVIFPASCYQGVWNSCHTSVSFFHDM